MIYKAAFCLNYDLVMCDRSEHQFFSKLAQCQRKSSVFYLFQTHRTKHLPTAEMMPPLYIYKYKIKIHHELSGQLVEIQIVIDTNAIQQREAKPW
jgi:hypothetical protein